jgi:N-methylhydantoinase B
MPAIADVESNEQVMPLLYMHRRLARDTGGAGRQRGGRGAEIALTLGGIEAADALIMTHGQEAPNTVGAFGGLPGGTVRQRFGRGVLPGGAFPVASAPDDPADLGGEWEEFGPKPGHVLFTHADLFAVTWQGGGGWGDPLDRDPLLVWGDVDAQVISERVAADVYGVIMAREGPHIAATQAQRRAIREARIGKPVEVTEEAIDSPHGQLLGEALIVTGVGGQRQVQCRCGHVFAQGTTAWRVGAIAKPMAAHDAPGIRVLHESLVLTAQYCPTCARLLAVDVHERNAPPLDDVLLD